MLQLQVKTPSLTWADRTVLAALARLLPSGHFGQLRLIISPRTCCAGAPSYSDDGGPTRGALQDARVRRRRDAPWCWRWPETTRAGLPAYRRRADRPGHKLAPSTVWKIPEDAGIDPAPERAGQT